MLSFHTMHVESLKNVPLNGKIKDFLLERHHAVLSVNNKNGNDGLTHADKVTTEWRG